MQYIDHRYGLARMRDAHDRATRARLHREVVAARRPVPGDVRLALARLLLRLAYRLAPQERSRGDPASAGPR